MLLFEIKIILTVFWAYFVQCSYAGGWTFAIPLIITLVWEASMFVSRQTSYLEGNLRRRT